MPVWFCDSYDGTHPARRELIRLLSSHLPVGKIPGIWEFILPLFYNSLSLSSSLLLSYSVPQNLSTITNQSFPLTVVFTPVTTNRLLFSVASASASSIVTVTHPLLLLLYHTPLQLIRRVSSSTCNHVICPFLQSCVLQASCLHAICLLFPTPKWLQVTTDCMALCPSVIISATLNFNIIGLSWEPSCHVLLCAASDFSLFLQIVSQYWGYHSLLWLSSPQLSYTLLSPCFSLPTSLPWSALPCPGSSLSNPTVYWCSSTRLLGTFEAPLPGPGRSWIQKVFFKISQVSPVKHFGAFYEHLMHYNYCLMSDLPAQQYGANFVVLLL